MNLSKILPFFPLIFVSLFMLYMKFGSFDENSLFYLSSKMVPALFSLLAVSLFFVSIVRKNSLTLSLTRRFYKNDLNSKEEAFLAKSDLYWLFVTLLNTLIIVYLTLYESNTTWAIYTSVGWYFYLFLALFLQVLYGIFNKIDVETRE